jgi:hypothetical protein
MAKIDSFEQFLKGKHNSSSLKKIDYEKRGETWIKSVNELYKHIDAWLAPFESKNLLKMQKRPINISEDYIGDYKIDRLDIYLDDDLISLIPRGTLVHGGVGVVDMRGPGNQVRLVEEKWGEWIFYIKTPFLETREVNKPNFQEIIQTLVNA